MTDTPHHCPGCGAQLRAFLRYPWYFCIDCRRLATDGTGARLSFGNATIGGGFTVGRDDGSAPTTCRGAICLIHGRPVFVHEARFGGVVAEPLRDPPRGGPGILDLRRGWPDS